MAAKRNKNEKLSKNIKFELTNQMIISDWMIERLEAVRSSVDQ